MYYARYNYAQYLSMWTDTISCFVLCNVSPFFFSFLSREKLSPTLRDNFIGDNSGARLIKKKLQLRKRT